MPRRISSSALIVCTLTTILCTGCVSGPRTFHASSGKAETVLCSLSSVPEGCTDAPQIVQGKPNQFVDGVGWVLGIPRKLILCVLTFARKLLPLRENQTRFSFSN